MALTNEGAQARKRSAHGQLHKLSLSEDVSNQTHFKNTVQSGNCVIFHGFSSRNLETLWRMCLRAMLVLLQLYVSLPSAGTEDMRGFTSAANSAQC